MQKNINNYQPFSPFLGMFEGKARARKAEEERKTMQLAADIAATQAKQAAALAATGYQSPADTLAASKVAISAAEITSTNKLYYVIGFIVLVLIIGVVLIKKSRKKIA